MSRRRRISAIERRLGRQADVTWQQAYAAHHRVEERLLAKLKAMASRLPPPSEDPVAVEADEQVLERWRRQRGIQDTDPEVVRAQLRDKLEQMERFKTWERT